MTGAPIKATLDQAWSPGRKVNFMVRPENLRVLAPDEQADNQLKAKLSTTCPAWADHEVLRHAVRRHDVSATQLTRPGQPVLRSGDEVRFGFDRQGHGLPAAGLIRGSNGDAGLDGARSQRGATPSRVAGTAAAARPLVLFLALLFVFPVGQLLLLSLFDKQGDLTTLHYVRLFTTGTYVSVLVHDASRSRSGRR